LRTIAATRDKELEAAEAAARPALPAQPSALEASGGDMPADENSANSAG